ncbi:MAG TPA: TIGR00645 family protein [Stellaceae bacterium]|nr:TIGR00645 family protein [Stellaceae bacterium]
MSRIERLIERTLFASRWLLVPLYFGLALFLVVIALAFFRELSHMAASLPAADSTAIILYALSLIDLTLVAGLLVMVMLSGYENFVSKLEVVAAERNLAWLGKLDAGSLKLKVAAAVVAISSINLLHAFMDVVDVPDDKLMWLVIIHLTFLASAFVLAIMERSMRAAH